jgi:hypothetical protein
MAWLVIRKLWVCVLFEINGEAYGYTYKLTGKRAALKVETLAK